MARNQLEFQSQRNQPLLSPLHLQAPVPGEETPEDLQLSSLKEMKATKTDLLPFNLKKAQPRKSPCTLLEQNLRNSQESRKSLVEIQENREMIERIETMTEESLMLRKKMIGQRAAQSQSQERKSRSEQSLKEALLRDLPKRVKALAEVEGLP